MKQESFDVVIVGAGAAGLMCALQAGKRGLRVLVLEHNDKVGAKILISGGGRCNFTNLNVSPKNFVSRDSNFCTFALNQYPSKTFIQLLKTHKISFHEKKLGQLFCDKSARDIVHMLEKECANAKVEFRLGCKISNLKQINSEAGPPRFELTTNRGSIEARSVVVATGGLSIPQIGATPLGYEIAKQFGLKITPRHPALDGFLFSEQDSRAFSALSGISLDCLMTCNGVSFRENLLFTHKGLSGPAALQNSLYWNPGDAIEINLLPDVSAYEWFMAKKHKQSRMQIKNILAELLVARFCDYFCSLFLQTGITLQEIDDKKLREFCQQLHCWRLVPKSTVGYNKAEVTRGGVDTAELTAETMEAKKVPGLYFIGEVVDVTGWLGGYNFQWAWASGFVAAQNLK